MNPCKYNDFPEAVETLRAMGVSYLNSEYDKEVLNKWEIGHSRQSIRSLEGKDRI